MQTKLKLLPTLTVVTTIIVLASNLGVDIKKLVSNLLNLKNFAEDTKIALNRIYGFAINGGVSGTLKFVLDMDVTNNTICQMHYTC